MGRKRVRRLMAEMGFAAICQPPRTTIPHPELTIIIFVGPCVGRPLSCSMACGDHARLLQAEEQAVGAGGHPFQPPGRRHLLSGVVDRLFRVGAFGGQNGQPVFRRTNMKCADRLLASSGRMKPETRIDLFCRDAKECGNLALYSPTLRSGAIWV